MSYTVLARRYRSQAFDEVVGQDAIVTTLRNAITANRVAHAYLFCGTRGVGKTSPSQSSRRAMRPRPKWAAPRGSVAAAISPPSHTLPAVPGAGDHSRSFSPTNPPDIFATAHAPTRCG